MTCEEVRIALGAHALGALDEDEAAEVDLHLATCEACGAELLDLEGVAAFLGKVSERDVELVASPPRRVLERLLSDRARRTRRTRTLLAVAASAAVLVTGGTVWTTVQSAQDGGSTSAVAASAPPAPESRAYQADQAPEISAQKALPSPNGTGSAEDRQLKAVAGQEFPGENRPKGYTATVTAFPAEAGTDLGVVVDGMPSGTNCRLVVVARDGRRDTSGSWVVGAADYQDNAAYQLRTTLALRDIDRFEVVDGKGAVLVRIPVER